MVRCTVCGELCIILLFNEEKKLKARVLNGLYIVVGGLALLLSGVNWFIHEAYYYAVALLGFSAFSARLYIRQNRTFLGTVWENSGKYPAEQRAIESYIIYLTFIVIWGCFASRIESGLLFWTLLLTSIYYFLLGVKLGVKLSAALMIAILALMLWKMQFSTFNPNIMVNYIASNISLWAISHYYEKHRQISTRSLHRLALMDPLTATYNRLALEQEFARLAEQGSCVHFIALDIDHFKQINDTYGHSAGDMVLRQVARRLQAIAGERWVYRLGGEEFCVLAVDSPQNDVASLAETIRDNIASTPYAVEDVEIFLSTSAGVATSNHAACLASLAREADSMLYQAKAAGRNQVQISTELAC